MPGAVIGAADSDGDINVAEPDLAKDTDATSSSDITNDVASFPERAEKVKLLKDDKPERLQQKIDTLQVKTKGLHEMLGLGKRNLELQEVMVQQSEVARRQNDANAAVSMSKMGAMLPKRRASNDKPSTSATVASKDTDKPKKIQSMTPVYNPNTQPQLSDQQIRAKREYKKKTRRELEVRLQGMQELLHQLTLQDPELETKVRQLTQSNEHFKELEDLLTLPHSKAAASLPNNQTKQRYDSEMSNASTVDSSLAAGGNSTSTKEQTTTNTDTSTKRTQRRTRGTKKKATESKCQESEQEELSNYLNVIVADYLGERQANKLAENTYKPGEDLEAYAQRLTQAGLGRIVEDELRVNRKNNRQSFISMSTDRGGTERDAIILKPVARRYAFDGDIVRAFVMNTGVAITTTDTALEKQKADAENNIKGGKDNSFCVADDEQDPFAEDDSPDSEVDANDLDADTAVATSDGCPKAFVIAIVKQTEKRQVVGTISFKNANKLNDGESYYKLKPHDMRVPMVYIPTVSCEAQITVDQKNDICGFLYVVKVRETDAHGHCIGELDQPVGKVGNLEAEIRAILLHNGLKDVCPYEERFNEMFAQPEPPVSAQDLKQREDLRKKCIFTIDPLTARDLDDAMSIDLLPDDTCEVGVHISDVAHYLHEDTELDNIVKDRATSIYLVNEVIHMLPKPLCFKCSLLPGEDKLAFSVFWRMNMDGDIIGRPRFTRSAINSCTQFAYEHAQKIIDNSKEIFDSDDFPTICNGFTPADIASRVLVLDKIAKCLRAKRYDSGALSINNPKLRFNMNPKTGEPVSYEVDGRQDANFLIEEFMLLANQSVARFIFDQFPDIAILRNHAPPLSKSLKSLKDKLASFGMDFDFSSSKTIYASMQRICNSAKDPKAMDACLSTLLTKPMARARYFCSEGKTEEADLWHYALSIPIYTHFTSPIRRYPDILVHRLLAAALNYCPPPKRTTEELHHMAKICNDQKFNAKNAGDESTNLFFKRYIKSKQYITLRAVVTEIFQHLINVVTIETGHAIAINYKMQKVLVDTSNVPAYILISEKNSKNSPLKLQMFSTVNIKVIVWDDRVCGFFISPDPKQRQLNSIESSKKKHYEQQNDNAAASGSSNASSGLNGVRKPRHNSNREANDNSNYRQGNKNKSKATKQLKTNERKFEKKKSIDH